MQRIDQQDNSFKPNVVEILVKLVINNRHDECDATTQSWNGSFPNLAVGTPDYVAYI